MCSDSRNPLNAATKRLKTVISQLQIQICNHSLFNKMNTGNYYTLQPGEMLCENAEI